MQNVDDDAVQATYREACRLTGMVCLRKASDGDVISCEEIKRDLIRRQLPRPLQLLRPACPLVFNDKPVNDEFS